MILSFENFSFANFFDFRLISSSNNEFEKSILLYHTNLKYYRQSSIQYHIYPSNYLDYGL